MGSIGCVKESNIVKLVWVGTNQGCETSNEVFFMHQNINLWNAYEQNIHKGECYHNVFLIQPPYA